MPRCTVVSLLAACAALVALPAGMALDRLQADVDIQTAIGAKGRPEADRRLDEGRKPAEILAVVRARAGDRVLDVLASPGYYSELLAMLVGPRGSVTAYDPPQFVASPGARANWAARIARHPNIRKDLQPLDRAEFGRATFDIVLLHLAYHETYWVSPRYGLRRMEPRLFARRLHSALRPGGRVVLIDHAGDEGGDPRDLVERFHRIPERVVIEDFRAAGFELLSRSSILANSEDDHQSSVFDPRMRGKTDRMVLVFRKAR